MAEDSLGWDYVTIDYEISLFGMHAWGLTIPVINYTIYPFNFRSMLTQINTWYYTIRAATLDYDWKTIPFYGFFNWWALNNYYFNWANNFNFLDKSTGNDWNPMYYLGKWTWELPVELPGSYAQGWGYPLGGQPNDDFNDNMQGIFGDVYDSFYTQWVYTAAPVISEL